MPENDAFPLQLPLHNKSDCQYARNLIAYCFREFIEKRQPLVLTIDHPIEEKTSRQHGGLFLWFDDLAPQMGLTAKEVRLWAMSEFFSPTIIEFDGKVTVSPKSFSELTKKDATFLMDQLEVWAAEHSYRLRTLKKQ